MVMMLDTPEIKDLENRVVELEKLAKGKTFSEHLTRTLFHISDAVNTFTDLDKLFPFIYNTLDQIMGLPNFYIALTGQKDSFVNIPFCIHKNSPWPDPQSCLFDTGFLVHEVLEKNQPIVLDHAGLKKRAGNSCPLPIPKIWMGVPIVQQGKPIGVMAVYSHDHADAFNQKDRDILVTVSHQIALAIDRKQSFDELRLVKNYLTNIINSMPSILIGVDRLQRITQWNLQAELETGVKAKDAKDNSLVTVFPRLSGISDQIRQSIQSGKIMTRLKQEYIEDQEIRYEDIIIYPLTDNGIEDGVIRIDDITDQVRMEERALQSEKLMSFGGLAASLAHEINNPLSGMMLNAQIVLNRLSKDLPANKEAAEKAGISMADIRAYSKERNIHDKLKAINDTGSRAAEIIKNMLGFARKNASVPEPHDLSRIVKETIQLVKNDYELREKYHTADIRINEVFDNIPAVPCDIGKTQQVFFNLIKNGIQALAQIPEKIRAPQLIFRIYKEGTMACVEIEDNGPGISEQTQKRIFEPFYTTKSESDGTGLGLSISYFIIVKDHHGEMAVESVLDHYTRFIVKLPY
jgi:PAS domain S-box-containing protein